MHKHTHSHLPVNRPTPAHLLIFKLKDQTDVVISFRHYAGRGGSRSGWQQLAHHSTKPRTDVPEPGKQVGPATQTPPPTLALLHRSDAGSSSDLLGITFNSHAFPGTVGQGAAICLDCYRETGMGKRGWEPNPKGTTVSAQGDTALDVVVVHWSVGHVLSRTWDQKQPLTQRVLL